MGIDKEHILPAYNFSTLSVFEILKHVERAGFMDNKDYKNIIPISLERNCGVFTKAIVGLEYPRVSVVQMSDRIVTSCSCQNYSKKMCEHQGETIHAILEKPEYRVFFDATLREKTLKQFAKAYGLQNESHLDNFFELHNIDGKLSVEPKVQGLVPYDKQAFAKGLSPKEVKPKALRQETNSKKPFILIDKHRYYNQLNFQLMKADQTKAGKLKTPFEVMDPMAQVWKIDDPDLLKFYTAIHSFQNKYNDDELDLDAEPLKQIVKNPLGLDFYIHERKVSESISPKTLTLVKFEQLHAEIKLSVFKKEPFYEITGELLFNDSALGFQGLDIRNDYLLYFRKTLYFIDNPDLLRVIKFFKANNEILIMHANKYEEFLRDILSPLEEILHINYSYIKQATQAQLKERSYDRQKLIYLQQDGNYISIVPVMKYGEIEVPTYSKKQLFDTDRNGNVFQIHRNYAEEDKLLSSIMDKHPDFEVQVAEMKYFYLHKDKFLDDDWFIEVFEQWREEDISILGFSEIKNNRINSHKAKISIEVISGVDWFNAKLKVGFGQQQASLRQIHRTIRNKGKYVQLDDGSLGLLPEEWIERIAGYFRIGDIEHDMITIPKINYSEVSDLFEKEVISQEVQHEIDLLKSDFSSELKIMPVPKPKALQAELRGYQQEGLNWLNFLDTYNFGGCLADDMGLGKTVQIIAFILSQKEKHGQKTNLIVVPTSLLFNWEEEISKFAPSLKIKKHYGPDREKSIDQLDGHDVVLTTYGMLLSDIRFLKNYKFNYIFLDESQAIKNPNSERYKAARLLQARNRIVLTGTPIENNTFDLYGQLSFANPGLLGSKQFFKDTYAIPIDQFQYSKRAIELQEKVRPFILRRTKKQVAKELPEKTEMLIYCEMNEEQRKIYEAYETELREFISANEDEDIKKNSMHVLTGLTKLRQICNSPVLLKKGHAAENAVKVEILLEQILNKSKEHKILVFSQFVEMLDLIRAELGKRNISFEYLTGQSKERGKKVHNFQNNEEVRIFLISLKAGGVGLNLTEADYVYLVDPWWNPAAENQAIDRSYRIGQTKNVVAVRLICSNTIEEKILKLQKRKSKLAQDLIQTENAFFNTLSKADILDML